MPDMVSVFRNVSPLDAAKEAVALARHIKEMADIAWDEAAKARISDDELTAAYETGRAHAFCEVLGDQEQLWRGLLLIEEPPADECVVGGCTADAQPDEETCAAHDGWGPTLAMLVAEFRAKKMCPDCAVLPGFPHSEGCDVARCVSCGHQALGHDECDEVWGAVWTGRWPGDEEVEEGLATDLNDLGMKHITGELRWDKERQRLVKA